MKKSIFTINNKSLMLKWLILLENRKWKLICIMLGFMDVIVFDTHSDVYSVINQSTGSSRSKRKEDAFTVLYIHSFSGFCLCLWIWNWNKTNYYSFIPFIHRMAQRWESQRWLARFIMQLQLQFREKGKKIIQLLNSIWFAVTEEIERESVFK